ncbi:MAG TPA: hypothetical protein VEK07_01870 [Polyangiaceae bacterium]|nr:hypothetical protein [Polyangiaceae bacterium]
MATAGEDDLEVPELTPEWFDRAWKPNRAALRRGSKRAVFIEEDIARRFGTDEELEDALRDLLAASEHVRQPG